MFRLVTFTAALCFLALVGYLLSRPTLNEGALAKTREAILAQSFSCPANTKEEIKRWHLDGYVRRCLDGNTKPQGPMIGWRSMRKVVSGHYRNGVRDGEWLWYGVNGSVVQHEQYKNGLKTASSSGVSTKRD